MGVNAPFNFEGGNFEENEHANDFEPACDGTHAPSDGYQQKQEEARKIGRGGDIVKYHAGGADERNDVEESHSETDIAVDDEMLAEDSREDEESADENQYGEAFDFGIGIKNFEVGDEIAFEVLNGSIEMRRESVTQSEIQQEIAASDQHGKCGDVFYINIADADKFASAG